MTTQPIDAEGFRTPVRLRRNRLHWFAGRTHEVLDGLGEPATWALTPGERGETVAELLALRSRMELGWCAGGRGRPGRDAAQVGRPTPRLAAWRGQRDRCGGDAGGAPGTGRWPDTATHTALAQGMINTAQAVVVVEAVAALPEEVADQTEAAEAHLLECAGEHDAKALRALGAHLVEVVAPDRADELIAARLEREEAEARQHAFFRSWSDGHGSRLFKGRLPELHATMLDAMLDAVANPARPDPIPRQGVTSPQVRGRALCELLERYPVDRLPSTGGVSARVIVTMGLDTLLGGLQAAGLLGTGQLISPGEARRLAAAAGVIPAVLGGPSQLLDLGRRRGFSEPQRIAMALRQGGLCNIDGCDRPATWADANHRKPWSQGGRTTIADGELICPRHHTLVHQGHHYPRRT